MKALIDEFGSRRAIAAHAWFRLLYALGFISGKPDLAASRPTRFVFVCTGNICRSAIAGARAQQLGLCAISIGIDCGDGHPADDRARRLASSMGIDLSDHRSTPASSFEPREGDLIIVMTPQHARSVRRMFPAVEIALLGLWLEDVRPYLHDPYSANDAYFGRCAALVVRAVDRIAAAVAR